MENAPGPEPLSIAAFPFVSGASFFCVVPSLFFSLLELMRLKTSKSPVMGGAPPINEKSIHRGEEEEREPFRVGDLRLL